ncbi:MAG: ATP-binding protein [Catenulisporales bacterium]|jgi:serine/threonine-protein kinase RsbW|nr:ATP-binding protein [Catenulisporales bacterium]
MPSVEVPKVDGIRTHGVESVLVRVPAHRDYVAVVRAAVAQLGARLGYTVSELIDLRLAVDEACSQLVGGVPLDGPPQGYLECRLRVGLGTLQVTVVASAAGVETPDRDGFGWNVLTALVDSLSWANDGVTARIDLVKSHSAGVR